MARRLGIEALLALAIIFSSLISYAAPSGVTYQGRILKPDGSPLSGTNVQFRMQIRAPDANSCLMYEELQSQNLSGTNGSFSLTINDGSGVRQDSTGLGLDRVFANRGTFTFDPATCASGNSYLAGTGDGRVLVVYFKDETMSTWEPMPPQKINFVPFAFESKQVAGYGAENLLRFAESDGTLVNTTPLNNAQYTELLALVNGTSNAFEKAGKLGGVSLPALGAGQAGQVLSWNGTGWETSDTVPTNSITTTKVQDSAITSAKIADGTIAGSDLAANISINTTSTIATSGTMSSNVSTTRDLRIFDADANPNENYVSIKVPASLSQNYSYVWPSAYGSAGQVLTTDATGNLSWAAPSAASQWANGSAGAIYYNGGNVGVGVTAPSDLLHIEKNQDGTTQAKVVNSDTGTNAQAAVAAITSGSQGQLLAFGSGRSGTNWIRPSGVALITSSGSTGGLAIAARNATSGNITFHAGGDLEKMRIGTDGRVGIGTATPAYLLDVNGTVNATALKINGVDVAAGGTPGGATTQVQFNNAGAFGGSADFVWNNTNGWLGLNMTPTAPLSVSPKGSNYWAAKFRGNSSYKDVLVGLEGYDSAGRMLLEFNRPGVGVHSIGVDTSDNFYWGIGSSFSSPDNNIINMAANGNVAIGKGVTAPNGKLDVKGSIVMSGATSGYSGFRVPAAAGSSVWQLPAADGVSGQALVTDGAGVLSWNSMASSNYWTKTISDLSYSGGNVGIGTSTPSAKLDVVGTLSSQTHYPSAANIYDLGSTSQYWQSTFSKAFVGATGGAANAPTYTWSSNLTTGMFRPTTDTIGFSTAANERMRIDATGNVGIGTTAPTYKLDVTGKIHATSNIDAFNFNAISSGSFNPLTSYNSTGATDEKYWDFFHNSNSFSIRLTNDAFTASQNAMTFNRSGTTLTSVVFPQGKVGIGATSPSAALQISAIAGFKSLAFTRSDNATLSNTINFWPAGVNSASNVSWGAGVPANTNDFRFEYTPDGGTTNVVPLAITNTGNVGIGKTAPAYKLDVNGAVNATALKINGVDVSTGSGPWTTATNDAYFSLSGNVGIGTSSPTTKLDVSGTAHISGTSVLDNNVVIGSSVDPDSRLYVNANPWNTTGDFNGTRVWTIMNGSINNTGTTRGRISSVWATRSGTVNKILGDSVDVQAQNGLGPTTSIAASSVAVASASSNNITDIFGYQAQVSQSGTGTTASAKGLSVGVSQTGGTITTGYGVYIDSIAGATNYGLYQANAANKNYFAGNVGIGTESPAQALDVTGAIKASTGVFGAYFQANDGCLTMSASAVGNNCAGQDLSLRANNSVMMTIKSTGNVGIGTSSPSSRLHVVGPNSGGYPFTVSAAPGTGPGAYMNIALNNTTGTAYKSSVDFQKNGMTKFSFGVDYLGDGTNNFGLFDNAANVHRMFIDDTGKIGMGTTTPSVKLEVVGDIKAANFVSTSDARLKKNVVKTPGLDYIRQLTGVQWQWKSDNKTDAGVIAQDVERVMPFAVVTDSKSGYKAVKYNALIAPLIESTKELYGLCQDTASKTQANSRAIASVQAENAELRKENQALKTRLDTMEERLKAIEAKLAK